MCNIRRWRVWDQYYMLGIYIRRSQQFTCQQISLQIRNLEQEVLRHECVYVKNLKGYTFWSMWNTQWFQRCCVRLSHYFLGFFRSIIILPNKNMDKNMLYQYKIYKMLTVRERNKIYIELWIYCFLYQMSKNYVYILTKVLIK